MSMKIYTDPKWIGKNIKSVIAVILFVWGIFTFSIGWFTKVNASSDGYPVLKLEVKELQTEGREFRSSYSMFLEMYKLDVLGRHKEAQELARSMPKYEPIKP